MFISKLRNASVKLQRANESEEGFDPISGFSAEEISQYIQDLPELGNDEELAECRAVLRRNGEVEAANDLVF